MRNWRISVGAMVLLAAITGAPALGLPINYGNKNGDSVIYQQVTESSATDDGTALFGAPSIVGDALTFSPVNFGISSIGGGNDYMDGQLTTTLVARSGYAIEKIKFTERGDYTLLGTGTAATRASVANTLILTILDLIGTPLSEPIEIPGISMVFTPSGGTYNLIDDPGQNVYWSGSTNFDVDAWLNANGYPGRQATMIDITLDNSLYVESEASSSAYIKKKRATGSAITIEAIVPEPATLGLLLSGGLLLRRRR